VNVVKNFVGRDVQLQIAFTEIDKS